LLPLRLYASFIPARLNRRTVILTLEKRGSL
jgi:hypothetical protein